MFSRQEKCSCIPTFSPCTFVSLLSKQTSPEENGVNAYTAAITSRDANGGEARDISVLHRGDEDPYLREKILHSIFFKNPRKDPQR